MAFFYHPETQRLSEDFKRALTELAETTGTKQDAIASCCHVSQPCVNHWMDLNSDRHLPAFLIVKLPASYRIAVMRLLGAEEDIRVNEPNGMIEDNVTDLNEIVGEIIRTYRHDRTAKATLKMLIGKLRIAVNEFEAEVEQ